MRIGIFETEHFEAAYPVIRLFDNGVNKITIFTLPQSYAQFTHLFAQDHDRYHWVVKQDSESRLHFLNRIYRTCRQQKIDLMYFNTVSDNHLLYAWLIRRLKPIRTVLTLHDINSHFQFAPAFSLRRWVRYLGKRALIGAVREFNVISPTMVDYLQERLPAQRTVHAVPGGIYEGRHCNVIPPADCGMITVVVPGQVDVRRRDYHIVFELLKACTKESIPVSVVLLGGAYGGEGKKVLDICRQLAVTHNLYFYETGIVPQAEYERVMDQAHIVFAPTNVETVLGDGVPETYGQSISSGNIFDVVKHAKPFIVPAALKIPPDLESGALKYEQLSDILHFLKAILAEPGFYERLVANALANSGEYTIGKVRARHTTLFNPAP